MTNKMGVYIQQIRALRKAGISTISAPRNLTHPEKLIWVVKATVALHEISPSGINDD